MFTDSQDIQNFCCKFWYMRGILKYQNVKESKKCYWKDEHKYNFVYPKCYVLQ